MLLSKTAAGDSRALGELYHRHHQKVYHFIKRYINQSETAEDVANDVFIEVWRKAGTFEGRSEVSSWILGIARFKALSETRKHSKLNHGDEEFFENLEDQSDTPEITTQKLSKSQALKSCIAKLSQDHRLVVDLVYYHDKSIADVAEILAIPASTVKTRAFHARKQLSAEMSALGIDRGWP